MTADEVRQLKAASTAAESLPKSTEHAAERTISGLPSTENYAALPHFCTVPESPTAATTSASSPRQRCAHSSSSPPSPTRTPPESPSYLQAAWSLEVEGLLRRVDNFDERVASLVDKLSSVDDEVHQLQESQRSHDALASKGALAESLVRIGKLEDGLDAVKEETAATHSAIRSKVTAASDVLRREIKQLAERVADVLSGRDEVALVRRELLQAQVQRADEDDAKMRCELDSLWREANQWQTRHEQLASEVKEHQEGIQVVGNGLLESQEELGQLSEALELLRLAKQAPHEDANLATEVVKEAIESMASRAQVMELMESLEFTKGDLEGFHTAIHNVRKDLAALELRCGARAASPGVGSYATQAQPKVDNQSAASTPPPFGEAPPVFNIPSDGLGSYTTADEDMPTSTGQALSVAVDDLRSHILKLLSAGEEASWAAAATRRDVEALQGDVAELQRQGANETDAGGGADRKRDVPDSSGQTVLLEAVAELYTEFATVRDGTRRDLDALRQCVMAVELAASDAGAALRQEIRHDFSGLEERVAVHVASRLSPCSPEQDSRTGGTIDIADGVSAKGGDGAAGHADGGSHETVDENRPKSESRCSTAQCSGVAQECHAGPESRCSTPRSGWGAIPLSLPPDPDSLRNALGHTGLKEELARRRLRHTGRTIDLAARLAAALTLEREAGHACTC